jgi:hypothetical protein
LDGYTCTLYRGMEGPNDVWRGEGIAPFGLKPKIEGGKEIKKRREESI